MLGLKAASVLAVLVFLALLLREVLSGRMELAQGMNEVDTEIKVISARAPRQTSPEGASPRAKDYAPIAERNIFGPIGQPSVPPTPVPAKPVSKVPLNLVGTYISKTEPPYAIIEDQRKGAQEVFDINESIFGEAKLVAVSRDSIEIERDGQREILKLEEGAPGGGAPSGGAPPGGEEITVDEGEIDAALGNLPLLLTQVRAVPYFKEGQPVGLRLFAIKSGSLFEKIGLRNGDILMNINGNSLGDFSQAVKLFERLKTERSIKVALERNRELKEYRYQIR